MFVINNIGGNLPILVDPLAKHIGYRESISVFYAGFYLLSKLTLNIFMRIKSTHKFPIQGSLLFFATMYFIEGKPSSSPAAVENNQHRTNTSGVDNRSYIPDQVTMSQLNRKPQDNRY